MRTIIGALLGAAALAVLTAGAIYGQSDLSKDVGVVLASGKYRDVTLWRNLKLGTAPFVNPTLLNQTSIAFKYDPVTFTQADRWSDFALLVEKGQLGVGIPTEGGGYEVMGFYDAANLVPVMREMPWFGAATWAEMGPDEQAALADAAKTANAVFVSGQPELLGVEPAGKIVTWDKGEPLQPPGPPAAETKTQD